MGLLKDTQLYANKLSYFKNARQLGLTDQQLIERLANEYCEAKDSGNTDMQNKTMAGLMLKFWYQQAKMHKTCKSVTLFEHEDYYSKLYECIDIACSYRRWQDREAHTNAQACINQTIASRGAAEILYQSNLDKHKANVNKLSINSPVNGKGSDDNEITIEDTIADETQKQASSYTADIIIQDCVKQGKLVDAIIIDNIAYADTLKETKEVNYSTDDSGNKVKEVKVFREFWAFRLVKALNSLSEDYQTYFQKKYKPKSEELVAALAFLSKANNQKLYKQAELCIANLKKNYQDTLAS